MNIFAHLQVGCHWNIVNRRPLTSEEKTITIKAKVVLSQYGKSIRFYRRGMKSVYIPLYGTEDYPVGKKLSLDKILIVTLYRDDLSITRVELLK